MKQLKARRNLFIIALAIGAAAAIAACSDSGALGPTTPASGSSSTANSGGTDTSHRGGGGTGGSGHDTTSSGAGHDTSKTTPPVPKPVDKFTLTVHVGSKRAGSADTLANDPISGAAVTVLQHGYVLTGHPGADSLSFVDTPIGSATTDASGNVSFANLKGTDAYVVKVDGPSGSGYGAATVSFYQAYVDRIAVNVILRKP